MSHINLFDDNLPPLCTNDGKPARVVGTRLADSLYRFVVAVTEWPDAAEEPVERIYYSSPAGDLKEPNVKKGGLYLVPANM